MTQLDLLIHGMGDLTPLERQALDHHRQYPAVLAEFTRQALRLLDAGHRRGGAKMIWERLRWLSAVRGGREFKLNNNYTAAYARMAMQMEPRLAGFFETREQD